MINLNQNHLIRLGDENITSLLIRNGANPNILNNSGEAALHWAAASGN